MDDVNGLLTLSIFAHCSYNSERCSDDEITNNKEENPPSNFGRQSIRVHLTLFTYWIALWSNPFRSNENNWIFRSWRLLTGRPLDDCRMNNQYLPIELVRVHRRQRLSLFTDSLLTSGNVIVSEMLELANIPRCWHLDTTHRKWDLSFAQKFRDNETRQIVKTWEKFHDEKKINFLYFFLFYFLNF